MPTVRFHAVFAAALLLMPVPVRAATQNAVPGAVQAEQSPTMPAPGGDRMGRGGKLGGFLTSEQRAMLLLDARDKAKDMTPEQRKTFRKDQLSKIVAMSPADRKKFVGDLQARWDALPAGQKTRLQQRLARQQNGQ